MTQIYTPEIRPLTESSLISGTQAIKSFDDRGKQIASNQIDSLECILLPLAPKGSTVILNIKQDIQVLSIEFYPEGAYKRSRLRKGGVEPDTLFHSYENKFVLEDSQLEIVYPTTSKTFLAAVFYQRVAIDITSFTSFVLDA